MNYQWQTYRSTSTMTTKKLFGYIFMAFAVILMLAILGQLHKPFIAFFGLFEIFSGTLDSYQIGYIIGKIGYWIFHFAATITLWVYGRRWTKKKVNLREDQ